MASVLEPRTASVTQCEFMLGYVVCDVICLATGAVGVRAALEVNDIEAIAEAARPALTQIEREVAALAHAEPGEKALAVFQILQKLYDAECLGAVVKAFMNTLTWWDMTLYGVTSMAAILAILASDGIAFAAEVVLLISTFTALVVDSVNAIEACNFRAAIGSEPTLTSRDKLDAVAAAITARSAAADPYPYEPKVAIRTFKGNVLTATSNGGIDIAGSAIETNRTAIGPWEKFTVVPLDANKRTFALEIFDDRRNRHYLTADNGGGKGGNYPVVTDRTAVGHFETLSLVQQPDNTYAICTTRGFLITAVNGGGLGGASPIHTNATERKNYEIFTLEIV